MKIKIAILDSDKNYLSRMVSAFSARYSEKTEIYSFTELDAAVRCIKENKIDIFLAAPDFDVDVSKLPPRCAFAYFVENSEIETIKDQRAISKFQKADLIYKQILGFYAENSSVVSGMKMKQEGVANIYVFMPVSGGAGSSTAAAAFAKNQTMKGKKAIYINFEDFGCADVFFSGEGQSNLSDIIYVMKSKKSNLALKLESAVKQDPSGVYFFSNPVIALDMMEMTGDDKMLMIKELSLTGSYDTIVIDMGFSLEKDKLKLLGLADSIVLVSDGSHISRMKFARAYVALKAVEEQNEIWLQSKSYVLYNKFSNKTSQVLDTVELKNLGGIPRFENADYKQIIDQIAGMNVFNNLQ